MASFRFRARDAGGRLIDGETEGDSAAGVAQQLIRGGVTPVRIDPIGARRDRPGLQLPGLQSAPDSGDVMLLCRQLRALTRAGIPIVRALRGLSESARHPVMVAALGDVADSLSAGRDLASGFARHPQLFSPLFVNVVRVGENSGKLDEAFERLGRYLEFDRRTRQRIKSALRYPVMVMIAIGVAIAVVMGMVVPQFARIFASFHAQLPLPTRLIIAVSDFTVAYWPLVLGAGVGVALGVRAWLRTDAGAYRWDRAKLRLPVVGSIILRATLARFARTFSMVVRSGVPLLDGLTLIARVVDNRYVGAHVSAMHETMQRGESVSRAAGATGLFTPLVLQMLAVGEETGRLDDMMEEIADYYDGEVQTDVDNLGALIEPLLITVVGGFVLILALGVFLPMWDLAGAALARR